MIEPSRGRLSRGWGAAVLAVGIATAARAEQAADIAAGRSDGRPDPRVVRILGVRQAGQGALLALRPSRSVVTLAVFADASHALSMVALAVFSARYRRAALLSAGIAASSAGVGLLAARQP
jgi:hypothetical protein